MAQDKIRIHMKNRKVVEIPQANLSNFKRIFHGQIDYVEEQEGEPIIAKPVIEEIKKPVIEEIKKPDPLEDEPKTDAPKEETKVVANESMSKKELQDLAKDIDGYKASLTKEKLVELINK